jgi:RNA polymerase sigma-70 factor (ECF subfamily)
MAEETNEEPAVHSALATETGTHPGADLEQIFREHHQMVIRAAYRVTGSLDDAQDVLQTVFLRLARREGGSPLSDSPVGYLHRAAINASLDLLRSRRAARSAPLEGVEPMLADAPESGPDSRQAAKEIRDQVRQALAKASPKAAEIFILRYFEGYGNHEIAGMLGTSRSTVNVILHRTRQKLRDELGPYVGEGQ